MNRKAAQLWLCGARKPSNGGVNARLGGRSWRDQCTGSRHLLSHQLSKSVTDTDSPEVAVVRWSWGGVSSLFAAARDPRIDALVSGLVKSAGDIHPERMTLPRVSALSRGIHGFVRAKGVRVGAKK